MSIAPVVFFRELSDSGNGLWVVGDARQAIYRFRGAAPVNMRLFPRDFHGAEIRPLKLNYRSYPAIVSAFSSFASQMQVETGTSVPLWEPQRTSCQGEIRMEIAEDADAEADGIALEIKRSRAAGVSYRDQAVLCRSHTTLSRIAMRVERSGIPVLYLGDLFERQEIRDLLSLLSLSFEGHGQGLLRVARFPGYRISLADIMSLLDNARAQNIPFPEALRLVGDLQEISDLGKQKFTLLSKHLEGLCYGTSAWGMLVQYLFERSRYLDLYVGDPTVAAQQQRLAIHQFLQFAYDMRERLPKGSKDPKRAFLDYVRGLEIYGEERQLRQVPEWASGINAVRFLTVHASKGLEFKAVYLPGLGQGYFPARRQHNPCTPPAEMLPFGENDAHEEEGECLFFVALSRSRDSLCLSRAKRYGKQNSNPSKLLDRIASVLPRNPDGHPTWRGVREIANVVPKVAPPVPSQVFDARDLDIYIQCPRKYYYEVMLGTTRRGEDSSYVQFHSCVYRVIRWMGEEHSQGHRVDEVSATERLSEEWEATGLGGHAYERIYWRSAAEMIVRAVNPSILFRASVRAAYVEHQERAGYHHIEARTCRARITCE
jgi:DNA helicase II / ATP-dependent DNA helicase PcrA